MPHRHLEPLKNEPEKTRITEFSPEIGFSQSLTVSEKRIRQRSKFQKIEIFESRHYGKVLVLDDVVNLTEKDADSYNEMLTHVPMMEHGDPKTVLVIGGGDGYVVREVLKYKSVERVDHVELDEDVIEICKTHFPSAKDTWDDERVHLRIENGIDFVRNAPDDFYDVIIQDSSDPFAVRDGEAVTLPSSVLYSQDHFKEIYRVLKDGGVLNFQAETIHIPSDLEGVVRWRSHALHVGFASAEYGMLFISTYITGQIGFLLCKKGKCKQVDMDAVNFIFHDFEQRGVGTTYYHPRLQKRYGILFLLFHTSLHIFFLLYMQLFCSTALGRKGYLW